ncbi:MAG TPA: hypothetical protein VHF22_13040, partial [Planctomycetota bacterium]|nr:hypothetical protein [Planctomycetota bacterium]
RAAGLRAIGAQEALVAELRTFLEEVKRVAPLWSPDLDDGAIINFAPLWRLVPHNKPWQRECKACFEKVCAGEYDWSHLAMHLFPRRVVEKCRADRSLAIAHGLEDALWEEDEDERWVPREVEPEEVEKLVAARTSPAVESALRALLEAPAAGGGGAKRSRRRGAGRGGTAGGSRGEGE